MIRLESMSRSFSGWRKAMEHDDNDWQWTPWTPWTTWTTGYGLGELWHWGKPKQPLSLPDYIKMSAAGDAKLINGVVHVKTEGPDPVIFDRMNDAFKVMNDAITKDLYEGNTGGSGLAGLFKKPRKKR